METLHSTISVHRTLWVRLNEFIDGAAKLRGSAKASAGVGGPNPKWELPKIRGTLFWGPEK